MEFRVEAAFQTPAPSSVFFTLIEALQHPERAIAYFLKRIRKGLRGRRLALVAPIAATFFSALAPFLQIELDSS